MKNPHDDFVFHHAKKDENLSEIPTFIANWFHERFFYKKSFFGNLNISELFFRV